MGNDLLGILLTVKLLILYSLQIWKFSYMNSFKLRLQLTICEYLLLYSVFKYLEQVWLVVDRSHVLVETSQNWHSLLPFVNASILLDYLKLFSKMNYSHPEINLSGEKNFLIYQPFSHLYGVNLLLCAITERKPVVIMKKFDMDQYIECVCKYKVCFTASAYCTNPACISS